MQFSEILDSAPDDKLSDEGIPFNCGDVVQQLEGVRLWVRYSGGRNYRSYLAAARVAVLECRANLEDDELPTQEQWEPYLRRLVAAELVARWDGVEDNDQAMEYTPAAGERLFERFPDLLYSVYVTAINAGRFRLDADTKSDPGPGDVGA